MRSAPPVVDRAILSKFLDDLLVTTTDPAPRLVLVHARYAESEGRFALKRQADDEPAPPVQVTVTDQPTVLGVTDAWHQFQAAPHPADQLLVVTTGATDDDVSWELRAQALKGKVLPVERATLVQARFRAPVADPRVAQEPWLVDALLAAEPATGWRPVGTLLTLDAAMQALVSARLGVDTGQRDGWDLSQLLAWSRQPGACDLYASLDQAERDGIARWLRGQAGAGAGLLLALAAAGRGRDAMALGVVGWLAGEQNLTADAGLALGGLFGGISYRPAELRGLARAVTGTLTRWISEAALRGGRHSERGAQVLDVVRRADQLAASVGLTGALTRHPLLPTALDTQFRLLAAILAAPMHATTPTAGDADRAEAALDVIAGHGLTRLDPRRLDVARMAVRLQRWLAQPVPVAPSVAAAVAGQLENGGWADRAVAMLWAGDPAGDGIVEEAYRRVHDAVHARRDTLDADFAHRLAEWAVHAVPGHSEGCLLIEEVQADVVAPLLGDNVPAPLVLVVDGMSCAVAIELAEQLRERGWIEASALEGRRAAVSMFPTVTRAARASLLTGRATTGDQTTETDGFTAFWKHRGREGRLFHKGDLVGGPGQRLHDQVVRALAGDAVVGIVLNTIDDALDHGDESHRSGWTISAVAYLTELLDAARNYGRPVVLTSDHGHVLERSPAGAGPAPVEGAQSARWRTGVPGDGEVEIRGPRVLLGDGRVVLPWRETLRYTPRKAGYHGGASLAEVTVPVIIAFPGLEQVPDDWTVLTATDVAPPWWTGHVPTSEPVTDAASIVPTGPEPRRRKPAPPPQEDALFEVAPAAVPAPEASASAPSAAAAPRGGRTASSAPSLGTSVVGTTVYSSQKAFVRKAPEKADVAAVVDALVAASGTLPIARVAALASRAGRRSEQVVTTLERLLNVEGYLVLSRMDEGRTVRLDVELLREQFGILK